MIGSELRELMGILDSISDIIPEGKYLRAADLMKKLGNNTSLRLTENETRRIVRNRTIEAERQSRIQAQRRELERIRGEIWGSMTNERKKRWLIGRHGANPDKSLKNMEYEYLRDKYGDRSMAQKRVLLNGDYQYALNKHDENIQRQVRAIEWSMSRY